MSTPGHSEAIDLPLRLDLPLFVYGALKPGFPAFEQIRGSVEKYSSEMVKGDLMVRDGLPMLSIEGNREIKGYLLRWQPEHESTAYAAVCAFEPRKHYQWSEVTLATGTVANALVIRSQNKGNPHYLDSSSWSLADDPAFGPGLKAVRGVLEEVDSVSEDSREHEWQRFFSSQMAYLLLWSIVERLSALCIGPGLDPMKRIKQLHELPGMQDLVRLNVKREDQVSDSRNPASVIKLDGDNAKDCFLYYYQVRSNLSHRGKGVFKEFDKVNNSLKELLAITEQYLNSLQSQGKTDA